MVAPGIDLLVLGVPIPDVERKLAARGFALHRLGSGGALPACASHLRAIVTRGGVAVPGALLGQLPVLELVAHYGVGYEGVDLPALAGRGVVVTHTPGVLDDEVADFAVALLLATVRQLPQAERFLRAGRWLTGSFPLGPTLRDRTVGLIGMGRIGSRIARRIAAFDVPVVYHARSSRPDVPWRHFPELLAMAREVDTLVAVVPGGERTRHLVGAEVLAALGARGILVNVSRGSVVDEAALVSALQRGTILAAGLDVFADEPRVPQALLDLENAVLVPHRGSATEHTRGRMGQLLVDNVVAWFEGRGPLTPIPETPWTAPSAGR